MPSANHFIVATAGHVDHGKSTLVRALTGTDPDRLPEEKARGITIDLGFAHLPLPGLELGIVDVPGHEDFVKNMVSGVGSVDAALFVVAADDGWMPQTEEHLQILAYLGVERAVVALTKIDLAEDPAASVASVRAHLEDSPFANAPIIPADALRRHGVEEIKNALSQILADAPPPRDVAKPRLSIDRVFGLRGIGTVVTGTLTGGTLHREQTVQLQPSGRLAHLRGLQNHGRAVESSQPGTRTALNLPELAASGDQAVARGEVVTLPELGGGSRVLDVLLTRFARSNDFPFGKNPTRPLQDGKNAQLHFGSGHWMVRVSLLERGGSLSPGQQSIARLRCDREIFALAGDRFILRDGSGRLTLAGGIVLDPLADTRRAFRRGAQRRFLERCATSRDASTVLTALLERDHTVERNDALRRWPFSQAETEAAIDAIKTAGTYLVDAAWWRQLRAVAEDAVDGEHRAHPEQVGLAQTRLRAIIGRKSSVPSLFDALVSDLTAKGEFVVVGNSIRRGGHRPALPEHLRAAGERLRAALARQPLEPPGRKELAPDGPSRQALRFLFDTGEAVELGEDVVLLEASYRRMKTIILRTLRTAGPATTSELRQVLGTTRRVLIPVLESLDREGLTRRDRDRRVLR